MCISGFFFFLIEQRACWSSDPGSLELAAVPGCSILSYRTEGSGPWWVRLPRSEQCASLRGPGGYKVKLCGEGAGGAVSSSHTCLFVGPSCLLPFFSLFNSICPRMGISPQELGGGHTGDHQEVSWGFELLVFCPLGLREWQLPVSGYLAFVSFQGRCSPPHLSHSLGVENIYFAD